MSKYYRCGPQHPAAHGILQLIFAVDGKVVLWGAPEAPLCSQLNIAKQ